MPNATPAPVINLEKPLDSDQDQDADVGKVKDNGDFLSSSPRRGDINPYCGVKMKDEDNEHAYARARLQVVGAFDDTTTTAPRVGYERPLQIGTRPEHRGGYPEKQAPVGADL